MISLQYSRIRSESEELSDNLVAHSVVSALCPKDGGRTLFRVDCDGIGPFLLVQSPTIPQPVIPGVALETKPVQIALSKRRYSFKVRANPTKNDEAGKRIGIVEKDEREAWLRKVFYGNGMEVEEVSSLSEGVRKLERNGRSISVYSCMFFGTVSVNDPVMAEGLLANGVGKCKAFGFGLISLRKA